MPTTTQLKKRVLKIHEDIDKDLKIENKALDHFEDILERHDDPDTNKLLHKILQIFEDLYNLEEQEKKLVEKLEGKEHKIQVKEIKAIVNVERAIEEIESVLVFPPKHIEGKLLRKLISEFKKQVQKQHQELTPKP